MERRTFLQGSAASLATWPFATAQAQSYRPEPGKASGTTVYNPNFRELNERRFDPLDPSHSPQELYELDLPFPDPHTPLRETWERVFSPPVTFAAQIVSESAFDYQLNPRFVPAQAPIITTRWEASQNWSGAYIQPHNGRMLTQVAGTWTIPDISGVLNPNSLMSSSIWIGLDGQRLYFDSSLPQIGTTQTFDKHGQPDYHAWHQWWERDQGHNKPDPINDVKLAAGDTLFCNIQVVNLTSVVATIANLTTGKSWTNTLTPKALVHGTGTPKISGASAQWVVERPTVPKSPGTLLDLVNYGTVKFINCIAFAAPAATASPVEFQRLDTARFIRMYDQLQGPPRTAWLSTPRRLVPDQQDAFLVTYSGP